jgi:hypothetical protein
MAVGSIWEVAPLPTVVIWEAILEDLGNCRLFQIFTSLSFRKVRVKPESCRQDTGSLITPLLILPW